MLFRIIHLSRHISLRPHITTYTVLTSTRKRHLHISPTMTSSPSKSADTTATTEPVSENTTQSKLPALPSPESANGTIKLDMSEGSAEAKLDDLGPLVVNQDGTVSRINNWGQMSDIEKENTLRILGKRNQLRLGKLRAETADKGE